MAFLPAALCEEPGPVRWRIAEVLPEVAPLHAWDAVEVHVSNPSKGAISLELEVERLSALPGETGTERLDLHLAPFESRAVVLWSYNRDRPELLGIGMKSGGRSEFRRLSRYALSPGSDLLICLAAEGVVCAALDVAARRSWPGPYRLVQAASYPTQPNWTLYRPATAVLVDAHHLQNLEERLFRALVRYALAGGRLCVFGNGAPGSRLTELVSEPQPSGKLLERYSLGLGEVRLLRFSPLHPDFREKLGPGGLKEALGLGADAWVPSSIPPLPASAPAFPAMKILFFLALAYATGLCLALWLPVRRPGRRAPFIAACGFLVPLLGSGCLLLGAGQVGLEIGRQSQGSVQIFEFPDFSEVLLRGRYRLRAGKAGIQGLDLASWCVGLPTPEAARRTASPKLEPGHSGRRLVFGAAWQEETTLEFEAFIPRKRLPPKRDGYPGAFAPLAEAGSAQWWPGSTSLVLPRPSGDMP